MEIFTSYFAKTEALRKMGIVSIAISRGIPKNYRGSIYQLLAPRWDMLKMPDALYTKTYNGILKKLNPFHVAEDLWMMTHAEKVALLCYEKPGDFCHRRLVAAWMEEAMGIKVEEVVFESDKAAKAPATKQLTMF